jgi:hypothetical protein
MRSNFSTPNTPRCASLAAELQAFERHLVVVCRKRPFPFEQQLGLLESLIRVVSEHALVEVLDRRERRSIPEQDVEELQAVDMAPEYDETQRQRRRYDQADRPPTRTKRSPRLRRPPARAPSNAHKP